MFRPRLVALRRVALTLGLLAVAAGLVTVVVPRPFQTASVRAAEDGGKAGPAKASAKKTDKSDSDSAAEAVNLPSMFAKSKIPDDDRLVTEPDLDKVGYFRANPAAVRGKTFRGQTILDAPKFKVVSRKDSMDFYPCSDCHEDEPANPKVRVLEEEHTDIVLQHGGGRYWCLTCHGSQDKNTLVSLNKIPIDFDQPYLLCGQCHFERQKDWFFGGHGKRLVNWNGERVIKVCTECHNPHSPSIKQFTAEAAPKVRKGLESAPHPTSEPEQVWVRMAADRGKE